MSRAVPLSWFELLGYNEEQLYKDEFSFNSMSFNNSFYLQFDMCN